MRKVPVLMFLLALNFFAHAQEKAAVEAAVRDYVDGFYYGDTLKIRRSISPAVFKNGYSLMGNRTQYENIPMSYEQCLQYARNVLKRGVSPKVDSFPKKIEVFDVQDKTASAKLTAWWGTDYLLLTKLEDRWMITHVLWQSLPTKK